MSRADAQSSELVRRRERQVFLAVTLLIGVLAGLSAVLFSLAIDVTTRGLFGFAPSTARLLLVPPLMSLLTGVLLTKYFPGVRGSGVPQTKAAFHLSGGVIPPSVPLGKFLTGVLCIGSGHSIGREGPSVQIGAGLASAIGQWLRLSPARVRELVPVGAAGALSAAFNTPVAAVIFSLEEIIGDMNASLLGSTVLASVASVVVERSILGNEPLFHVPPYRLASPAELLAYAFLGVVGGLVSIVFCRALLGLRAAFRRLPARTTALHPAMGGVAIGVLLTVVPQVMGVGYQYVDQALNGGLIWTTMALLLVAKLVATVVSYSSGNAGGIFAPSLYVGAMVGGIVGTLVRQVAPFATSDPGAYALVGMGALFAGIVRAPMTSVFMIFEITQDYQILVPLMVANLLSFAISRRFQPVPVYQALLLQDNVHLPSHDAAGRAGGWRARDVMQAEMTFVPGDATIDRAAELLAASGEPALPVGDREALLGLISADPVAAAAAAGRGAEPMGALVETSAPHAHPDDPLEVVFDRFSQGPGVLPIVSRLDSSRVEGLVTAATLARRAGTARQPPPR